MNFYHVGDVVKKVTGDYKFQGRVVSIFQKISGETRLVVENNDGVLHIFNPKQLILIYRPS